MNPFRRFFLAFCLSSIPAAAFGRSQGSDKSQKQNGNSEREAGQLLDRFHLAAANAQFADYFSCLSSDAIFLGTDATERWTVEQFKAFAKPHFDKGTGWTYRKAERHILVSTDGNHASFDEMLDNIPPKGKSGYGRCRGTGVLRRVDGEWKIEQYHLTIPIPNDLAKEVVKMIRDKEGKP
jgi:hypothetical protein